MDSSPEQSSRAVHALAEFGLNPENNQCMEVLKGLREQVSRHLVDFSIGARSKDFNRMWALVIASKTFCVNSESPEAFRAKMPQVASLRYQSPY